MKRKIIRQIEIEYLVDIDIHNMRYPSMANDDKFTAAQIKDYFHVTENPSIPGKATPSITNYCKSVSEVHRVYTNEDGNLYVYSDIEAKIIRDITVSNNEVENE